MLVGHPLNVEGRSFTKQKSSIFSEPFRLFTVAKGTADRTGPHDGTGEELGVLEKHSYSSAIMLDYLCDTMKLLLGGVPPYDVEVLLMRILKATMRKGPTPALIQRSATLCRALNRCLGFGDRDHHADSPPGKSVTVAVYLSGPFSGSCCRNGFVNPLATHKNCCRRRKRVSWSASRPASLLC
jgi:hypothetical protein